MIASLMAMVLMMAADRAGHCRSLTDQEGDSILRQVPEAARARSLGASISLIKWSPPGPWYMGLRTERHRFRMIMASGGKWDTLSYNGLVGYYALNRTSGAAFDVNGNRVEGPVLTSTLTRINSHRCGA